MRKLSVILGSVALVLTGVCTVPVYADTAAAGTPVTCKDGTAGKAGKGACSHHGGVDKSAAGAASTSAPTPAPTAVGPTASPSPTATPSGASVTCKDGSAGKAGKGACSHHGGVDKSGGTTGSSTPAAAPVAPTASASAPAPAPTASAPTPAAPAAPQASTSAATPTSSTNASNTDATGATAKCKDGTYSHSKHHSGSCSHHGGVAQFLQ